MRSPSPKRRVGWAAKLGSVESSTSTWAGGALRWREPVSRLGRHPTHARVKEYAVKLLPLQCGEHILPAAEEKPGPSVPALGYGMPVHVWVGLNDGVAARAVALHGMRAAVGVGQRAR